MTMYVCEVVVYSAQVYSTLSSLMYKLQVYIMLI